MTVPPAPPGLPRGIRNNNPGNIRLSPTRWKGQRNFQFDPAFVEFTSPLLGLRALMRLLLTYHFKYGLDSVTALINRYAPPHENATDGYIHQVSRKLGVERMARLDLCKPDVLIGLARAIVRHENGPPHKGYPTDWYAAQLYAQACKTVMDELTQKENA